MGMSLGENKFFRQATVVDVNEEIEDFLGVYHPYNQALKKRIKDIDLSYNPSEDLTKVRKLASYIRDDTGGSIQDCKRLVIHYIKLLEAKQRIENGELIYTPV